MKLFTFFLDYAGGTYVSQLRAQCEETALSDWIATLRPGTLLDGVSEEIADAFEGTPQQPIPLDELTGVWCATANARDGFALLNIVQTAA